MLCMMYQDKLTKARFDFFFTHSFRVLILMHIRSAMSRHYDAYILNLGGIIIPYLCNLIQVQSMLMPPKICRLNGP